MILPSSDANYSSYTNSEGQSLSCTADGHLDFVRQPDMKFEKHQHDLELRSRSNGCF